jgi:hypothetical protein
MPKRKQRDSLRIDAAVKNLAVAEEIPRQQRAFMRRSTLGAPRGNRL